MKFSFGVFILCATVIAAEAQVLSLGGCPKVETVKDFDLNRYLGHWYEQARFPASFESGQVCANANYSLKEDGHIKIFNYGQDKNGNPVNATGDAYIPNLSDGGKLKLRFSDLAPYGSYWVVDTDYDTFTLIYSCTDLFFAHLELAWVLTRDKEISEDRRNAIFKTLASYGVKTSNFMIESQANCPTYS